MSSQEARVSLFGDLTRVSFYGERQGLFFRGTQQPGGGEERHRGQQLGENGVAIKPGSSGFRQAFTQQQG